MRGFPDHRAATCSVPKSRLVDNMRRPSLASAQALRGSCDRSTRSSDAEEARVRRAEVPASAHQAGSAFPGWARSFLATIMRDKGYDVRVDIEDIHAIDM